ncbi:MAG: preprotein translocase subunit YajC [Victivallaceae bacterium]|nr:preprotein translocase subunit YajC [Victivallaceae bacterium]
MNGLNLIAEAQQGGGSGLMTMLPLILVFGVMMFFMIRSQKKQARERQAMLDRVVKGARVLLQSGIYGNVAEVRENVLVVEIAEGVKIEVAKSGVAALPDEAAKDQAKKN